MLGFFELTDADRPDERIWLDDEALTGHFEQVNNRYKSQSGSTSVEAVPDVDEPNELTRDLRRARA